MRRFAGSRGMGRALRHRQFSLFVFFGWISTIGYWVQRLGIQWLAWELTGSYAWLGIIALSEALTLIVVMPLAGVIVDRVDRLWMARLTRFGEMLASIIIASVVLSGHATVEILVLLVIMAGAAQGMWSPARMALMPNLVPRADLTAALGVGATLFHLSHFVGPMVAGLIITKYGVGYAFVFNATTFALFLGMLAFIREVRQEQRTHVSTGYLADIRDGLRFVLGHPAIAPLMAAGALLSLFLRSYRELLAGYADGLFGAGASGLAAVASGSGIGALTAALLIATYARTRGLSTALLVAMAVNGVVQIGFALAPSLQFAVMAAAGLGFLVTIGSMSAQVLLQNAIPGEKRGRVMSLWGVMFFAGPSIGAWLTGMAANAFGLRAAIVAGTLVFLGALVVLTTRRGRLKSLEVVPAD